MIFYLHGLNSAGSSAKAALFRQRLAPVPVLSPTYPAHRPERAVACLNHELKQVLTRTKIRPLLLVGSSMGGFYGQYLARQFPVDHLLMINPALRPWELLRQELGWQYNQALDQHYELTEEMVAATRRFTVEKLNDGVPTTLILDKGDELIDWRIACAIYAETADVYCFEGGNHAFAHMDQAVKIVARIHRSLSR